MSPGPSRAIIPLIMITSVTTSAAQARRSQRPARLSLRRLQQSLRQGPERLLQVIVPSFGGIPLRQLKEIQGLEHYAERTLSHSLWQLRDPRRAVIFISHTMVDPAFVDSILSKLPEDAHERLHMISLDGDRSARPLTQKLLCDEQALAQIRALIDPPETVIVPFLVSGDEKRLARQLGLPLLGTTSADLNTKSGSHRVFQEAAIPRQPASIGLCSSDQLIEVLYRWYRSNASSCVAIKLDSGVSGLGIIKIPRTALAAVLDSSTGVRAFSEAVKLLLPVLALQPWTELERDLNEGYIVEQWFEGRVDSSPSVQGEIAPDGSVRVVATHEQVLEGPVYQGATFPAFPRDRALRAQLMRFGERIGRVLARMGAIGCYGADFVYGRYAHTPTGRRVLRAIEINLRQGGTTHLARNAIALSHGRFDRATGLILGRDDRPVYYVSTDNGYSEALRGYRPSEVIRMLSRLDVNIHLLAPEHGKIGFQAFGSSPEGAQRLYDNTLRLLRQAPRRHPSAR